MIGMIGNICLAPGYIYIAQLNCRPVELKSFYTFVSCTILEKTMCKGAVRILMDLLYNGIILVVYIKATHSISVVTISETSHHLEKKMAEHHMIFREINRCGGNKISCQKRRIHHYATTVWDIFF